METKCSLKAHQADTNCSLEPATHTARAKNVQRSTVHSFRVFCLYFEHAPDAVRIPPNMRATCNTLRAQTHTDTTATFLQTKPSDAAC